MSSHETIHGYLIEYRSHQWKFDFADIEAKFFGAAIVYECSDNVHVRRADNHHEYTVVPFKGNPWTTQLPAAWPWTSLPPALHPRGMHMGMRMRKPIASDKEGL